MRKQFVKLVLLIMTVLFILGIRMMLTATSYGLKQGNGAVTQNGGSMETNKYYLIIETCIDNYRTAGAVMASIGGLGFVIVQYQLYQESKESE